MFYICPLCKTELQLLPQRWCCAMGHSFDVAKEGYVNLLPVNKKGSKDPGDNQQMMFSRRSFLEAGGYLPLLERIIAIAQALPISAASVLDVGCGEGYYSSRLQAALPDSCLQGMDISKTAVRYASKKYPHGHFCVASAYEMPFADNRFDLMLKIFAPAKIEELARVCRQDGFFISVTAGPEHHFALKQLIYQEPRKHPLSAGVLPGFVLQQQERLRWQLQLPAGEISRSFLQMTPYFWKFTDQQLAKLQQQGVNCEIDFLIEVFQRESPPKVEL